MVDLTSHGYLPGTNSRLCLNCRSMFVGHFAASHCKECAVAAAIASAWESGAMAALEMTGHEGMFVGLRNPHLPEPRK